MTLTRLWRVAALLAVAISARAGVPASVVLTPNSGAPGEIIQVDGATWLTDDSKTIEFVEATLTVGDAFAVDGGFGTTFATPDIAPGVYTVRVSDVTEFVDATFTVLDVVADPITISIMSDADGDGDIDSSASPYLVLEASAPPPALSIAVSGGAGGEYTLEFTNLPALGALIDPSTTLELVEGAVLPTTGGVAIVEFVGVPQATASFSDTDSFIVRASDETGFGAPVIVELLIADVNQPVIVEREPSVVIAAGSTTTIPLVNFDDVNADQLPDPSVYDTDGDAIWFATPSGVSDLGVAVGITQGTLTYYGLGHSALSPGEPVVDTIAVEVWDGEAASPATMTVTVSVHPVAELGLHVESGVGFAQSVRVGFGPPGDIEIDGGLVPISDLTRELSPPDAPAAGFGLGIINSPNHAETALRDIRAAGIPAVENVWEVSVRTGSTDGAGTVLWWDVEQAALVVAEITGLTGEPQSAVLTNGASGEAWDITSFNNGTISLEDNQAYTFALSIAPSVGAHAFDVNLESGWNLLSVPGEGDLSTLDALTNTAFAWDGEYVGLAVLDSDSMPSVTGAAFVHSSGGIANLALDVDSSSLRSVTTELPEGWSLVGAPSDTDVGGGLPASVITQHLNNQNAVFGYDSFTGYFAATELHSGNGYWVYNDAGVPIAAELTQLRHLALDGSSLFHPAPATPAIAWSVPLTLDVGGGVTRRVEIATADGASERYGRLDIALPPAPPGGAPSELFARVADGVSRLMRSTQPADRSGTEWTLSADVGTDGAALTWERPVLPAHWQLTLDVRGATLDMVDRRSIRLERGAHELHARLSWVAPSQTRLLANYPNPFNPE
ncbi:hypothetical protein HOK31_05200, partial [Candidatus Poribacteria bacterium]|nr:hypothetical protein [Candidatus Poribacteria bacterium]